MGAAWVPALPYDTREVFGKRGLLMPMDRHGYELTTTPTAAASWVDAADRVLAADGGALEAFDRAIAADDAFALGHAGRARVAEYPRDVAERIPWRADRGGHALIEASRSSLTDGHPATGAVA